VVCGDYVDSMDEYSAVLQQTVDINIAVFSMCHDSSINVIQLFINILHIINL
jgi:hypothetical protein